MKKNLLLAFALILAICCMSTSCTGDKSDILAKIPAKSALVSKIDVKKGLDEAGFKFESGKLTAPDYLADNYTFDRKKMEKLSDLSNVIDLSNVYMVRYESQLVFMAPVTDSSTLNAAYDKDGSKEYDGLKVSKSNSSYIVSDGNILWIFEADSDKDAADWVKSSLKDAKEASIKSIRGVEDALAADKLAVVALKYSQIYADTKMDSSLVPEELANAWGVFDIASEDNSLVANFNMISPDGEPLDLYDISEINAPVLNYVPADFNLVAACGNIEDKDMVMKGLDNAKSINFQAKSIFEMLEPYIKSMDGTSLLAAQISDPSFYSEPSLDNWNVLMMIHMEQEMVNSAVNSINSQLPMLGLTPEAIGENIYKASYMGRDLYFGNIDGYLGIATVPFSNDNTNALANKLIGHTYGFVYSSPKFSDIVNFLPGYTFDLTTTSESDSAVKYVMTINGTTDNFITTVLKLIVH